MRFYGMSDIGLVRSVNQDSFCATFNINNDFMAIVCDGIGGGKAGDVASSLAVESMRASFLKNPVLKNDEDVQHWLHETINEVNDTIFSQSTSNRSQHGMGTTMVGIIITKLSSYVFNIGDSRAYAMYDDLICLTEDHNLLSDLLRSGEVSQETAHNHPQRHVLTNALGIWDNVRVDIARINNDYTQLLICSDGLHGYVKEGIIKEILLLNEGIKVRTRKLIDHALEAGGLDNVTVILIDQREGDLNG